MRKSILAFAVVLTLFGALSASAFEGPRTPVEAMDACCAHLFGKWRGKGWVTLADGRRAEIDAEVEVIRSESGSSAFFLTNYTPLKAGEGQPVRKIALLTYVEDGWANGDDAYEEYRYSPYRLRYLWGGPFWGVRIRFGPISPAEWLEPHPGGGVVRYFFPDAEVVWSLAGFCCSGEDTDRLTTFILLTRVGPLAERSWWYR